MKQYCDGGEAILEAFRSLGLDYIISSPGSEWSPVWEALARQKVNQKSGPSYIDCWHETLAVDMAMGYTQMTGRMQAVYCCMPEQDCCRARPACIRRCSPRCRW
jgi:acetolactate synthase-1/2/3 large subunit